jgi:hypothetical protein
MKQNEIRPATFSANSSAKFIEISRLILYVKHAEEELPQIFK